MDLGDIFLLAWLEWIFIKVEDRYGTVAAWIVTAGISVALIAALVWVIAALL